MKRVSLILFAACAPTACAALFAQLGTGGPSDQIKIPHAVHTKADVLCLQCHEEIYDATGLEGDFLPKEETCMQCHKEWKEAGDCAKCHTDVERASSYPKRAWHLKINHADHIERLDEDCARCHEMLPEPLRTAALVPTMEACLDCHEHRTEFDQGQCDRCHVDLARYPLLPVAAFSHQEDFVKSHRLVARSGSQVCGQCHQQDFCADCHARTAPTRIETILPERVTRNFIHRNDFTTSHGLEASADSPLCQRCHATSFCDSCHRFQNLTPMSADPRNPHPPNYAFPGGGHATAARRDIASCAACHDQGPRSVCIECHRVGGIGGNPHPPSWLSRHFTEEIQGNAMCLYCHR